MSWQTAPIPNGLTQNHLATLQFENNTSQTKNFTVILSGNFSFQNEQIGIMHNTILDSDGDGLSDPVEYELGTCAKTFDIIGGYFCGWDIPTQDTDNDGLTDYAEVVGETTTVCNGWLPNCYINDTVPLPLWGSEPLHKNVFIEVDWDSLKVPLFPYAPPPPPNEPPLENIYLFDDIWASVIYSIYKEGNSADLQNPSGLDGVKLHFDIKDAFTKSFSNNSMFIFDGGGSTPIPSNKNCSKRRDLRLTEQSPLRRQYMHYYCISHVGGGGQADRPGLTAASGTNAYAIAHELGHNLNLTHSGGNRYNGSPLYMSQMNYTYTYNPSIGFSQGEFSSFTLNPSNLSEVGGVGGNDAFLEQAPWNYTLYPGNGIDWDRNGSLNSNIRRAAITWAPDRGTNAQLENSDTLKYPRLSGTPHSNHTPSLVRIPAEHGHGDLLYILYRSGTNSAYELMHYNYLTVNSDGTCLNDPFSGDCGNWSNPNNLYIIPTAFSATSWADPNRNKTEIYIADVGPTDIFSIKRVTPNTDGSLGNETTIKQFSNVTVKGTPAILSNPSTIHVVWRDQNNQLWEAGYEYWSQNWVGPSQIGNYKSYNDPTLLYNYAGVFDNYLAFTNSNNQIQILQNSFLGNLGAWSPNSTLDASAFQTQQKIGLAWQPYNSVSDPTGPGFLVLGYVNMKSPGQARLIQFHNTGMLEGYLGNQWTNPDAGIEFLGYNGDRNIKASFHNSYQDSFNNTIPQLHYYPIADGIFDYELKDSNDFKTMRTGVAQGFVQQFGRPYNNPGISSLTPTLSQPENVICPGL